MNDYCAEHGHNFDEIEKLPSGENISVLACERCQFMALMVGGATKPMGYGTPQWTSYKPICAGWYWFRIVGEVDRTVIRVTHNDQGCLQAEAPSSWVERDDVIDTSAEEWAGPLEEPPA